MFVCLVGCVANQVFGNSPDLLWHPFSLLECFPFPRLSSCLILLFCICGAVVTFTVELTLLPAAPDFHSCIAPLGTCPLSLQQPHSFTSEVSAADYFSLYIFAFFLTGVSFLM